uniref:Cytochrome b n=1 Tax=Schizopera knabeni TaxID=1432316 RepID=W8DNC9_9MAXI|nr:cytochrome b [Schizopera knabeni]
MKTHPVTKIVNSSLIDLPSPANISTWWNFGSLLGLCLAVQLASGVFLAMFFSGDIMISFGNVLQHITQDEAMGWFIRATHANGASLFFLCLYLHAGRGLYYGSYRLLFTWVAGVAILLLTMAAAFLGYVLPWGQMSFWGATVITGLISAIPILGQDIVVFVWGGFSVSNSTLTRFFAFHYLLPFIVLALVLAHLLFLHQTGSSNVLGVPSSLDKAPFHPYFSWKDLMGALALLCVVFLLVALAPWKLGDVENFILASSFTTPVHIQPEWYFLFAYAILRSIPNKLGGVVALVLSILILLLPAVSIRAPYVSLVFSPANGLLFWVLISSVLLLTWIGARPVEDPYVVLGQLLTLVYFSYFAISPWAQKSWALMLI